MTTNRKQKYFFFWPNRDISAVYFLILLTIFEVFLLIAIAQYVKFRQIG